MAKESQAQRRSRVTRIITLLQRYYPDAHCALHFRSPEELIVATILSAQCTDARVNLVTPALFRRYPDMKTLANAPAGEIEDLIRSTGFFRNKAKNLKAMAEILVRDHLGVVPQDHAALVRLPGVGRKTANVVMGNAFGETDGIAVDTHVQRLSRRLGLTNGRNPVAIERDLCQLVPKERWVQISHWLITHGRQICKARKPVCDRCFLSDLCPKKGVTAPRA